MKKESLTNIGFPLFIEANDDLSAKPKATTDSWYVRFNFCHEGREIGFEWHQMIIRAIPMMQISIADFLLMDGTRDIWLPYTVSGKCSKNNAADDKKCCVKSEFGIFEGTSSKFTLKLKAEQGAADLVLIPTGKVFANGATGLLHILGSSSYQYAFPNMKVSGIIQLKDESIKVDDAIAWMDRQWTNTSSKSINPNWVWIGMCLDPENKTAISIWDGLNFENGTCTSMATLSDVNDVHSNHVATFNYDEAWKSTQTGNYYPRDFRITIPTADIELSLHTMQKEPEFVKGIGPVKMAGCQALCMVKGHYGDILVDRIEIVEMLGDICS